MGAGHRSYQCYLNKITQAIKPRGIRESLQVVLRQSCIRQLHIGFRLHCDGARGGTERNSQRIQPQAAGTQLTPSVDSLCVGHPHDCRLLAASGQHRGIDKTPLVLGGHTGEYLRKEGRSDTHGQRFLHQKDTRLSGIHSGVQVHMADQAGTGWRESLG